MLEEAVERVGEEEAVLHTEDVAACLVVAGQVSGVEMQGIADVVAG